MNKLVHQFQTLNAVYKSMEHNFLTLKKMFRNHSTIKQKIHLAEAMVNDIYMSIKDKYEETETKREFNRIIKGIKDEK